MIDKPPQIKTFDKAGILVVLVGISVAIAGFAYIFSSIYIETMRKDFENEQIIDLNNISVITTTGTVNFVIVETNETLIEFYGPTVYVSLTQDANFSVLFVVFENKTEHDAKLISQLSVGKIYNITFIDFFSFSENEKRVVPRNNVLVDVEEYYGN